MVLTVSNGGIENGGMVAEISAAERWWWSKTHTSFLRHIQINAQCDREALVTNWRLCNYECSYMRSGGRQSMDVSPAAESYHLSVSIQKTRRGRLPLSALLPCAWQALSPPKLHVAPPLLKCKFEKHYRVVNISIFLILKLGGRKTVWYCMYPTVLSPKEQLCDPNKWTTNPPLQCMWLLHATVCCSPLFSPNLSSHYHNCIWWRGETGMAEQETVKDEEEQQEGEQTQHEMMRSKTVKESVRFQWVDIQFSRDKLICGSTNILIWT